MILRWLDSAGWALFLGFGWASLAFLVLPTLVVVPMSFGENQFLEFPPSGFTLAWYRDYFTDPTWIKPTLFSFQIAFLVALGSTIVGTATALALVRGRPAYRDTLQLFVLSPVIAPNIVVGLAMFFFFAELHMIGNLWAFVIGHSVLAIPYVVLSVSAALQRADHSLELAALGLGASRVRAFFLVTVPSIRAGIISGAIFAFIISFDEPVISFF
ncbi:MAG: ABC transporter permease, partial [Kiloniellales bacterium]|nr:ABC transporter permease [Kiloniellales bacterium]